MYEVQTWASSSHGNTEAKKKIEEIVKSSLSLHPSSERAISKTYQKQKANKQTKNKPKADY